MKPAPFAYERPRDVASALAAMAGDGVVKVMAGGQSLGPMLNLRLVAPDTIVDITGLAELKHVEVAGEELVIGACVTHADIEDGRIPDVTRGAMQRVASAIAYRAVRNRGTIGGSLSHADPSADWVSTFAALGATLSLRSAKGARLVVMKDFMLGALESVLQPGEMLEAVRVPVMSPSARWGYVKSCRKTGEFAHAIGAVLIDPEAGSARVVIGAVEAAPIIVENADEMFGGRVTCDFKSRFDGRVADTLLSKAGMSDAADRHIHVTILRRAVAEAAA
ncbi:carbon-monoxide dehydrogenase medium subunit [Tardiphaga sp. OK246]|jgi:carbon-monoxide dehydrogenase medium subunit|uniref:FAD binding domain-containing protein n=1 Tax=Tardiphaga sp. OK246 TaxID=1855307 RepID=UPI000B641D71|nr:FAD binding domain-containing protein [Tardiphaga sp. OK246]SNT62866.1 carbon-monoxide dehydrogenase medium subunit [Tardiphaga sp. OK246]